MRATGHRFKLQRQATAGATWQTYASSDDRVALERMFGGQVNIVQGKIRLYDQALDKVIMETREGK